MEELRKNVRQELAKRQHNDWSSTKPPKQHAIYAMIKNLHAAGTNADYTPKPKDQ